MGTHKQCLLLGANGQLGKAIRDILGEFAMAKTKENLDIVDKNAVEEILDYLRPDVVINAAGHTDPVLAEAHREETWRANTLAVDNLAKGCATREIPFIHVSCDQVFGSDENRRTPYTEEDTVGPTSHYGTTKLAAESIILRIAGSIESSGAVRWPFWIIRTSCLFEEPWRNSDNVVYRMMQMTRLRGRMSPLPLPRDVVRCPTYAPHLAKSLVWLSQNFEDVLPGIYNIVNPGRPASLSDIGFFLSTETRSRFRVEVINRDIYTHAIGCSENVIPKYTSLDASKFSDICPHELPTWEEALEEYVAKYVKYEK